NKMPSHDSSMPSQMESIASFFSTSYPSPPTSFRTTYREEQHVKVPISSNDECDGYNNRKRKVEEEQEQNGRASPTLHTKEALHDVLSMFSDSEPPRALQRQSPFSDFKLQQPSHFG